MSEITRPMIKVNLPHRTTAERAALCEATVTLNGEPAKIVGYQLPYAKVVQASTGLSAEWAWESVGLIVARGGRFQS